MHEDYVIKNTKICGVIQGLFYGLINTIASFLCGYKFEDFYACLYCTRNRHCNYGISFVFMHKTARKIVEYINKYYEPDESWQKPPSELKERLIELGESLRNLLCSILSLLKYGEITVLEPELCDIIRNSPHCQWLWKEGSN